MPEHVVAALLEIYPVYIDCYAHMDIKYHCCAIADIRATDDEGRVSSDS